MTDSARQYALAVFSLAREQNNLEIVLKDFSSFMESFDQEVRLFFLNPGFNRLEKKQVISKMKVSKHFQSFLFLLVDNDRFDIVKDIYDVFLDLILHLNKMMNVTVISKTPLSIAQKNRVVLKLEQDYSRVIHLDEVIDESIIAGYKLVFEGNLLDDTIGRRLSDLQINLKKN
ncbi:MAG: ATP synthase F1 subunit delta [Candidatus Izemoplasmatales bacterium]|jgi:F-type H+-transporting ATPase subunit delta|nr:ATP synthase F1 subunit delta [Candidatus Izemoplasmatales bacterium]